MGILYMTSLGGRINTNVPDLRNEDPRLRRFKIYNFINGLTGTYSFRGKGILLSSLSYNGVAPVSKLRSCNSPSVPPTFFFFYFLGLVCNKLLFESFEYAESWQVLTIVHHKAANSIRNADRWVESKVPLRRCLVERMKPKSLVFRANSSTQRHSYEVRRVERGMVG